jgi:hypothetical protein
VEDVRGNLGITPAQALTITAAASLLLLASRRTGGQVEAGEGDYLGGFSAGQLLDTGESLLNQLTERAAGVDVDTASRNSRNIRSSSSGGRGTSRSAADFLLLDDITLSLHMCGQFHRLIPSPLRGTWQNRRGAWTGFHKWTVYV